MKICKSLYILLLLLWSAALSAQTYNFSQFAEDKGLAQSYIYNISQSRQGYLVLSAGEALCMFDGRQFTAVYEPYMKENIITTHYIDSRGTTWLGHQQQGLSYIKYKRPLQFGDSVLKDVKVFQMMEAGERLWVAASNGLYQIDSNFILKKMPAKEETMFRCIQTGAHKDLLAGGPAGLVIFDLQAANASPKYFKAFENKNIKQIISAGQQAFWILTDDTIFGLTYTQGNYKIARRLPALTAQGTPPSCIYDDADHNLWISVFGEGLRKLVFRGNNMSATYNTLYINKSNGLQSNNIQCIFQDREGNMWFGTFGEGLIKKPLEMFSFFGKAEGMRHVDIKRVISIYNKLWLATSEGVGMYDKQTGAYLVFNGSNGFVNDKVTTLFADEDGTLWIGTAENGVYTLNPLTYRFNAFKAFNRPGMPVNWITRSNGRIMIATPEGLSVFGDGLSEQLSTNEGLFHNNVRHVFEDSKRRLWISSYGAPPYYIQDQTIVPFKKIDGLSSYNIAAVCEDAAHNIWIATDGDGVFKYDNKTFFNYTTEEGLLSDYCTGIEVDKNNSVWVTHRSGISELKNGLRKFAGFVKTKGLLFTENNVNAVFKDSLSNLWFGTDQGVVAYNIESGKAEAQSPEIFITDALLNKEHFHSTEPLTKAYGYYSLHIEFKAISLADPDAIFYKYRFTDLDSAWKITNTPYIDFPRLADGEYHFEVMACNNGNGLCSNAPATLSFVIQKPFWKHIWFYLLLAAITVLGSYAVIVYRTRKLKTMQDILKQKVEEKTYLLKREKEAVEVIKTDLEHKNKDITDSIHYAKNIQDSLLPPDELMQELFNQNSFVLFKPKDIVSGDFYWCSGSAAKKDFCLAAVIDCTGHGVPGAFLSILANDFLKQALEASGRYLPNDILDYLNKNISSHLNQHPNKNTIRDGMDIALIGIDYSTRKLYFSGANNPAYLFRKTDNGTEEIIIKPTKQAIGSVYDDVVAYELQEIDLQEGDTIYLFSDGYADQFGGEKNKKLTYKRFRMILMEALEMPVSQQKMFLDKCFEDWRNSNDQTDDICVMGIRI